MECCSTSHGLAVGEVLLKHHPTNWFHVVYRVPPGLGGLEEWESLLDQLVYPAQCVASVPCRSNCEHYEGCEVEQRTTWWSHNRGGCANTTFCCQSRFWLLLGVIGCVLQPIEVSEAVVWHDRCHSVDLSLSGIPGRDCNWRNADNVK